MKHLLPLFLACAGLLAFGESIDASSLTEAPIVRLDIFKNGSVLVKREVTPKKDGPLYLSGDIQAAHGTLWLDQESGVTLTAFKDKIVSNVFVDIDNRSSLDRFCGHTATILFESNLPDLEEDLKMLSEASSSNLTLEIRSFSSRNNTSSLYRVRGEIKKPKKKADGKNLVDLSYSVYDGFVVQLPAGGKLRLPSSCVRSILADAENPITASSERKLWKVEGATKPFGFQYLTQGLVWAPSYRAILGPEGKGKFSFITEIRNELEKFENAEVYLISGFPRIDRENETSLMNLNVSLNRYLSGATASAPSQNDYALRASKISYMSNRSLPSSDFDMAEEMARDEEEFGTNQKKGAVDINVQKVGRLTLGKDETLRTSIAEVDFDYKQRVQWIIRPIRTPLGTVNAAATNQVDNIWDTLVFKNPFDFPMTTAPLEVILDGDFYCQVPQTWVNPGQECTTHLTKALSIYGKVEESEEVKEGGDAKKKPTNLADLLQNKEKGNLTEAQKKEALDGIFIFNNINYRQVTVNGKASLKNYRDKEAEAKIQLVVNGELKEINFEGAKQVGENSVALGANTRSLRTFEVTIPAKGSVELTYVYTIYVKY